MRQRIQHRHQRHHLVGPGHIRHQHKGRNRPGQQEKHPAQDHAAQDLKPLQGGLKPRVIAVFGLDDLLLQPQG